MARQVSIRGTARPGAEENAVPLRPAAPVKSIRLVSPSRPSRPARIVRRHDSGSPAEPAEFDRLVHEQTRLGILSALAVNDALSFNDLKKILKTTDGNLSVHARKLEVADYIACSKFFQGRRPKTEFRLTRSGRGALRRYLDQMEQLIRVARAR